MSHKTKANSFREIKILVLGRQITNIWQCFLFHEAIMWKELNHL